MLSRRVLWGIIDKEDDLRLPKAKWPLKNPPSDQTNIQCENDQKILNAKPFEQRNHMDTQRSNATTHKKSQEILRKDYESEFMSVLT